MARKPAALFNVHRANDATRDGTPGAQIITGVPLALARSECARLNAEAGIVEGEVHKQIGTDELGVPITQRIGPRFRGMFMGELVRYEVRSAEGLVVA